jgi:hypothetical protein
MRPRSPAAAAFASARDVVIDASQQQMKPRLSPAPKPVTQINRLI